MDKKKINKIQLSDFKTIFPVPYSINTINFNVPINTFTLINTNNNVLSNLSEQELIEKAFKFHSENNYIQAEKYYASYVKRGFNDVSVHSNYGIVLSHLGKLKEAEVVTKKAIELDYKYVNSHINLSSILNKRHKYKEAERAALRAIDIDPNYAFGYNNLGLVQISYGKLKSAEKSLRKAINLKNDFSQAYCNLGLTLRNLGKFEESITSLKKAIQLDPDFKEAYSNLSAIYKGLGETAEAKKYVKKALEIDPYYPDANINMGLILLDATEHGLASKFFQIALKKAPQNLLAHRSMSILYRMANRYKDSEKSGRKAISIDPTDGDSYMCLGEALIELGRQNEGFEMFDKAVKLEPNNLYNYLKSKIHLSPIPSNKEQIDLERSRLKFAISRISKNKRLQLTDDKITADLFYLAYQNCDDDKEILGSFIEALSNIHGVQNKSFNKENHINQINPNKPIKLGIFSDFLSRGHAVYNFFWNTLKDLSSSPDLEITIFQSPSAKKGLDKESIDSLDAKFIQLPVSIPKGCETILGESLDILMYLDIGMSPYSILLSVSRLALIQVNALGHTNTSGAPNIDYALSDYVDRFQDNNEYFSERLVRFSRIRTNYSQPVMSEKIYKHSDFDIPDNSFLIGLPHSLFKIHPDFDCILDQILKEIPNSYLILPKGSKSSFTDRLKERWSKNNHLILDRTRFFPRVDLNDFVSILKFFDIILCPIYYGMGNTLFQSIAVGTPVVGLESKRYTSLFTSEVYHQMNIKEPPIAYTSNEYIDICKRLAFDLDYRQNLSKELIYKSKEVFNDNDIYKEYIEFFHSALEAAKKGSYLPHNWKCSLKK